MMDIMDKDRSFANVVVPMMVYYILLGISYITHRSKIVLDCFCRLVNVGAYKLMFGDRHCVLVLTKQKKIVIYYLYILK